MKRNSISNWFHSQSIRNKVLAFGVMMSTIPLLLISYFYYTQVKVDLEQRILEKQELLTKNLSNEISLVFNQTLQQIQILATLSELDVEKKGFYELLQQNESIEEVVLTNGKGHVVNRVSRYRLNLVEEKEQWFTDNLWFSFQTKERVIGEVEFNPFGQPVIKMAIPHIRDGERYGIGVIIQLQKIIGEISSLRQDASSYLFLVDQREQVISHQNYSKLWGKNPLTAEEDVLQVKTEIDELGWTLVMEQPKSTAYRPIHKMFQTGITAVAISTLLISLISIYAGLYFTKPILRLDHAMSRVKLGKKSLPLQLKQKDEIGQLAETFNDMTAELHEKSLQLKMEKERLNVVVEGIGAGLALVTKDYRVTWMNPILQRWIEHKDLSFPCYALIGGYDSPCLDCPITDVNLLENSGNKVMTFKTSEGVERTFQHRVFPLNHAIEGEGEYLVVIEDITEQKEIEEKMIQTDKLSALGLMASSFAHEVNNPLTSINVYAEDLADRLKDKDEDLDEEEMQDYLTTIIENTTRCKRITSNLLNFSRKSNWNLDSVDLKATIQNSVSLIEHTLKKKGILVQVELETSLPEIMGDSLQLMQVFVNLLNNAVDAMDNGGLLRIKGEYLDGHVRVSITDSGIGIPKEDLTKIFDPFYTTKPVGKGTGLGLSVCYGIIQQFGGKLEIDSEQGKGTCVTIDIPIKEEE